MLNKAKVLDHGDPPLLSWASSCFQANGSVVLDDPALLTQIVANAVASALRATQHAPPVPSSPPSAPRNPITMIADTELHTYPHSSAKMDLGHIQVAHTARSTTVEAQQKIRDCSCVAIEPKFSHMDFSKLVLHCASEDLGTMVLAQQTMMDSFALGASW
jgi:hypothetical protein